ncbi:hypothetical protein PoB_000020700 [Plakobranchus ocellatus]|uniref:Uncharacterized protein n=1 Tax=Plakobranchus ocellatus TaxID=259542 RepID=A0AAV3XV32_9GAST|nr:hypothetical protein PoB_000020700 [Plakobranchus ocellatus]
MDMRQLSISDLCQHTLTDDKILLPAGDLSADERIAISTFLDILLLKRDHQREKMQVLEIQQITHKSWTTVGSNMLQTSYLVSKPFAIYLSQRQHSLHAEKG